MVALRDVSGGQNLSVTTWNLPMPTAVNGDRIYCYIKTAGGSFTGPAGFTLQSTAADGTNFIYYLDVVGDGPATAQVVSTGVTQMAFIAAAVRNPSTQTFSAWYEADGSNVNDPPPVSPTSAPAQHLVLSFVGSFQGDPSEGDGSTGYTTQLTVGAGASEPLVFFQTALVDVETTENPDSWLNPGDGGGNGIRAITIAVASSGSPNRIGGSGAIRRPSRNRNQNNRGGGGGGRPVDTGPPPDRGGGRPSQPPAGPPPTTDPTPDDPLEYPPEVPTIGRRRVLPGEDEPTTDSGD